MEFKDYYQILGIDASADDKVIKTAYRKLARKYHPDMNPDAGAEEKFKEVAEAYDVLKNAERRAEYDELRQYGGKSRHGFEPPPGWQAGGRSGARGDGTQSAEFSDFFNSIFSGGDARGFQKATGQRQSGRKGQDVEVEMPIFLEDTLVEEFKTVEFNMAVREAGQIKNIKKTLKVKIPMGVRDGERIRLKGQGAPGDGGAVAGDLYLHIRLVPHPLFDVEGHNLIITVPVSPWEAALGTRITVPTLDGKINLTIAGHTQSGTKMRIKGKGLRTKSITGDLYAVLKVVMPPSSNAETMELWRQLKKSASFDARAEWRKKS